MLIKIEEYLTPYKLPKKLFLGRYPPSVPRHSPILKEWYQEVAEYCVNGVTIKGRFYNPLLYHWLNLFSFLAIQKDDKGNVVGLDTSRPLYCSMDHYVLDYFWDAKKDGKHISLMTGRGYGKTYLALSVIQRQYTFFKKSFNIISAYARQQANTDWGYLKDSLNTLYLTHPEFYLQRISSNDELIKSGVRIITDDGDIERGMLSEIHKIIYGRNPDATRSMRPDTQLIEEFGAFPGKGKGALDNVLFQSEGSTVIGGNFIKTFWMLLGTGGSMENDIAKEIFFNPDTYGFITVPDFNKKSGIFVPTHYKYSGTWEKTGFPNIETGLVTEKKKREKLKEQKKWKKLHQRQQEFPINIEEVFLHKGNNRFNQDKITTALSRIFNDSDNIPEEKVGMMREVKDNDNNTIGFEFVEGVGNCHILYPPQEAKDGVKYENLYIMGMDSIDIGTDESTERESMQSHLVSLIKKRINNYFTDETASMYVAWYDGRSSNVKYDYEQVLMMALWYNSMINLEYTKVGFRIWLEMKGYMHMLMHRPRVSGGGKTQYGTTAAPDVIKHQDKLIETYIDEYYDKIFIASLLEQLRDYDPTDRRKFDYVVAMGMAEVADEDMFDRKVEKSNDSATKDMPVFGYYRTTDGRKLWGRVPQRNAMKTEYAGMVTWRDKDGTPHYD